MSHNICESLEDGRNLLMGPIDWWTDRTFLFFFFGQNERPLPCQKALRVWSYIWWIHPDISYLHHFIRIEHFCNMVYIYETLENWWHPLMGPIDWCPIDITSEFKVDYRHLLVLGDPYFSPFYADLDNIELMHCTWGMISIFHYIHLTFRTHALSLKNILSHVWIENNQLEEKNLIY